MYNLTLSYVWLFDIIRSNYDFEVAAIIRRFLYYFCIFRIFRFPSPCPLLSIHRESRGLVIPEFWEKQPYENDE